MKELGWKRMSKKEQEQFRQAYRVLYSSEEEFLEEMEKFDPKFQVIPNVSFPAYRRALVERLLSGKRRDTDPYRTGQNFHFEDIKYFLGDELIDLFFYGNHEPKTIRILFRETEFGYGSSKPLKLAKTALDNVGVPVRNVIFGAWDSDSHSNSVRYYFHVTNTGLEREQLDQKDKKGLAKAEIQPAVPEDYKGPLLVIQNTIAYGRKNRELESFLSSRQLGIDYRNLIFNFIGRIDFDPWTVPSYYVKNALRLI